ncbi:hypothetical protein CSOJ01_08210 [Colletotrichum sojae]|uniref:Uncharacterized protein n=1 Tax=Colletotrichum sojae TaxID=2175907 RepID=A0A8H6J6F3_9PEZI|nr:hypothetical protein CSOJ01_08210 [Colletotrichum sojae]
MQGASRNAAQRERWTTENVAALRRRLRLRLPPAGWPDHSVANIKSPSARPQRRPAFTKGLRSLPPQREPTPAQHHVNCSSPALNICSPSRDTPYPVPVPCGSHGLLAFASSDDMHKAFASPTSPHPAAPAIAGPSSLRQECFTPAIIPDAARRSRPFRVPVSLSNQRPGAREMDWESKTACSERCSPPPSHDRPTCPQRRVMDFSPRPLAECRMSPVNPESVDDPWDRPDPGYGKDTSPLARG